MQKQTLRILLRLLAVVGFVYLFLVSIGLMGASFKGFGKEFAENLIRTTSNPFIGLFIGILATSLVQSSSTTTSMVVGMVAGGVMTIQNAVPIIMGANIGTTVTNLLVSFGHVHRREEFKRAVEGAAMHDFFNQICVLILFPLELMTGFLEKTAGALAGFFQHCGGIKFTSPIKTATKPVIHWTQDFFEHMMGLEDKAVYIAMLILSIVILFICLFFIVKIMRSLVVGVAESAMDDILRRSGFLAILAGVVFTTFVQSSSITTSILVPIIASGIFTAEAAFPITLGANIGTTTTAILASFATGNLAAITIAFVHFLFNMIGVSVIYPIRFMRRIPLRLARWLGEMAFRKRRYAFIYVFCVFFLVPITLIFVSRNFF